MTVYYVGPGGNDGNDGLSWANRFLTLNGAEDEPVASGDTVYVGPGIYREQLTCDVDGASEIAYIADVTGIHTDGVGGDVIISGSDGDTTATRAYGIYANTKSYRTFIGFHVVGFSLSGIEFLGCDHIVLRDCCIDGGDGSQVQCVYFNGSYDTIEMTRCVVVGGFYIIRVFNSSDQGATSFVISDCLLMAGYYSFYDQNVHDIVIQNSTIIGETGIYTTSIQASETITVRNCCVFCANKSIDAGAAGEITTTYCQVSSTSNDNWSAGTGDVTAYVMNLQFPILYGTYAGIRYPVPLLGELNPYAYAAHRAGSSETSTDLFGITKPATAAISSWGAIQFQDKLRETTTTRNASAASVKFETAGEIQIWVPVDGSEITVSVYCYREADYAGTNPRMVIKQPGQADRTTTDAAAASQWNQLTDTFTPSGDTDYIVVCLQSLNTDTANAATNDCFFEDLTIS